MNLKTLLSWSEKEFSHLPWRQNRSLYRTLVSEIMLQQTTVSTVTNHFEKFMSTFPTLESLAEASESELLVAWKGLGYYRRARNLKKIAEVLTTDYQGHFPHDSDELMKIKGIGPYTSNAIIGIGMDKKALALDANLERVISRLFNLSAEKGLKLQKEIQHLFLQKKIFNQKVSFRKLNEALMDIGRTFCQARRVSCEFCPLKNDCYSFQHGVPLELPYAHEKSIKKTVEHDLHLLRVFVMRKDQILVYQKSSKEWLSGQFEVPTFIISSTDKKIKQYPIINEIHKIEMSFKTAITKYKINNSVAILSENAFKKLPFETKCEWRSIHSEESNFSTTILKAIDKLKLMNLFP
jgi:A/G-specific adenine glycosylase